MFIRIEQTDGLNMMDTADLQAFEGALLGLGLQLQISHARDDGVDAVLVGETGQWMIEVKFKSQLPHRLLDRATYTTSGERPPRVLFIDHAGARTADVLRREGVQFLDRDGNASLTMPGLHVDVRGRARQASAPNDRSGEDGALFTPRRSQVLFVLLTWPDLLDSPVRTVAACAGVSVGIAQQTIRMLVDRGYLDRARNGSWLERDRLQQQWLLTYPDTLGRPLASGSFNGDPRSVDWSGADGPIAISGEAAVPEYIEASTLTFYSDSAMRATALLNRWRTDREPNIFVRRRFWTDPDSDAHAAVAPAPRLLIYADLRSSRDPRQRVVAEEFWNAADVRP